jgi:hypothetical protein
MVITSTPLATPALLEAMPLAAPVPYLVASQPAGSSVAGVSGILLGVTMNVADAAAGVCRASGSGINLPQVTACVQINIKPAGVNYTPLPQRQHSFFL